MSGAYQRGDLPAFAKCLSIGWELKKWMAPGAEPKECRAILDVVKPYTLGATLGGAGGGGFLLLITKGAPPHAPCQLSK